VHKVSHVMGVRAFKGILQLGLWLLGFSNSLGVCGLNLDLCRNSSLYSSVAFGLGSRVDGGREGRCLCASAAGLRLTIAPSFDSSAIGLVLERGDIDTVDRGSEFDDRVCAVVVVARERLTPGAKVCIVSSTL